MSPDARVSAKMPHPGGRIANSHAKASKIFPLFSFPGVPGTLSPFMVLGGTNIPGFGPAVFNCLGPVLSVQWVLIILLHNSDLTNSLPCSFPEYFLASFHPFYFGITDPKIRRQNYKRLRLNECKCTFPYRIMQDKYGVKH